MREGGAASGRDDAPLGAGEFGEALTDAIHELVHLDEVAGGFVHGALYFGKSERAGDDGEGSARVEDGADADGLIEIRADVEDGCGGAAG